MENSQSWARRYSDLPRELLSLIGKRIDTSGDALRFRSVCRSWRASLPKSNAVLLHSRLRFPSLYPKGSDIFLTRRIIYRFGPFQTMPSSPSTTAAWLAKVESTKFGQIRFRDKISQLYVRHCSTNPQEANWLNLRFEEVATSYWLESRTIGYNLYDQITKVVLSPDSIWTDRSTCTIVAIYSKGTLGFAKYKGESWRRIDDHNFDYDDVIVYKGKICSVTRRGTVSWFDSMMKLIKICHGLPSGNIKHLVECGGELYAVEGLTADFLRDSQSHACSSEIGFGSLPNSNIALSRGISFVYFVVNVPDPSTSDPPMKALARTESVIHFNVYKLIQKEERWEKVSDLGDHALLLGNDGCFSVSAPKCVGLQPNCIYFKIELVIRLNVNHGYNNTYAFNLKERRIYKDNTVKKAPIWLLSKPCQKRKRKQLEASFHAAKPSHKRKRKDSQ